jgi:hypothetical protein
VVSTSFLFWYHQRSRHVNYCIHLGLKIRTSETVLGALQSRGHHNVSYHASFVGVTQFISTLCLSFGLFILCLLHGLIFSGVDPDTGLRTAVSDPRKDGRPAAVNAVTVDYDDNNVPVLVGGDDGDDGAAVPGGDGRRLRALYS